MTDARGVRWPMHSIPVLCNDSETIAECKEGALINQGRRSRPGNSRAGDIAGDIAVDGLLYGLVAGAAMILLLVLIGWVGGATPAEVLAVFSPRTAPNPASGLFSHLAVSVVGGIVWAFLVDLALRRMPVPLWLAGALYGFVLFAFATGVVAQNTALATLQTTGLLAAHLAYGLILGLLSMRQ